MAAVAERWPIIRLCVCGHPPEAHSDRRCRPHVFIEAPEVLALLDYTEALIAALRETLPYVCDMIRLAEFAGRGDIDSAIAVRDQVLALIPPEPQR